MASGLLGSVHEGRGKLNLVLQRTEVTNYSTIGKLLVDSANIFWTLEDVVRPDGVKRIGATAIPSGKYRVVITQSQRFRVPLPLLLEVPNFTGVRIHAGNTTEDTEGCILIGLTKSENFIGKSQMALSLFLPKLEAALKEGEVWIDVRNPMKDLPRTSID